MTGEETITPGAPQGLTPSEALVKWGDRASVQEMMALKSEGYGGPMMFSLEPSRSIHEVKTFRYRELREQLQAGILSKLQKGELWATGYDVEVDVLAERS